jgi:hypothetical protein
MTEDPKASTNMDEWIVETKEWPPKVREVALKYPVYQCYRSTEDPEFHYVIRSYGRDRETDKVVVELVHASGTPQAGVMTFGQNPDQLLACNCGNWQPPTTNEIEAFRRKVMILRQRGIIPFKRPPKTPVMN